MAEILWGTARRGRVELTDNKVAKVTVLKDRDTRQSLFVTRDDALKAARCMDKKILNGRTLQASIAADNGRAAEFIRKKVYKDKSRCYECGEEGHLSYECPKNFLGPRERPPTKKGRSGGGEESRGKSCEHMFRKTVAEEEKEDEEDGGEFEMENWASAVDGGGAEERLLMRVEKGGVTREKKEKKKRYFSDVSDNED